MSWAGILAENSHNFVRAESLRPISIEAVALAVMAVMAWRRRSGGLLALYALVLPFNDVVYRLGPLTLADVIGVALLASHRGTFDRLFSPIGLWLAWGLGVTLWVGLPFFSVAYALRFAILLLVASAIQPTRQNARTSVECLSAVTILAGSVAVAQVVLWRAGAPVDGVFAAGGFVRPKALSHEPSTAAVWFGLALPLVTVGQPVMSRRRRRWLIAAIVAGLLTTASLVGFLVAAAFLVGQAWQFVRRRQIRPIALVAAAAALTAAGFLLFGQQTGALVGKVGTYVSEYAGGSRPTSLGDVSGREGDLALVEFNPPGWVTGTGLFTAPKVAAAMEESTGVYAPAANILLTTAIETGYVGLGLFLAAMLLLTVAVVERFGRSRPAFVASFVGFEVMLLGQRFLAFPQPWFMLAVARALDHPEPPSGSDTPPLDPAAEAPDPAPRTNMSAAVEETQGAIPYTSPPNKELQ